MAESIRQSTLSPPQKRPLEDDALNAAPATPPKATALQSTTSSPLSTLSTVASPSPVKKTLILPSQPPNQNNAAHGSTPVPTHNVTSSADQQPPAKKRKLTEKEKEDKRLEKETKEKAKAELKAQKDEEKRQKDEEKRKKNEEREEKKRAKELEHQQKEEEKRKKDEEKRKKEEEKQKKEKSQLRLNAFFSKPKPSAGVSITAAVESTHAPSTEPVLLEPDTVLPVANPGTCSPQKSAQKTGLSDYERYFLPFQPPSRSVLAPYNRYMEDHDTLAAARVRLDQIAEDEAKNKAIKQPEAFKAQFSSRGTRGANVPSVLEIIERMNGSSDHPIDLTTGRKGNWEGPVELLKQIPTKYLLFPEDVRPPYYGTYTKPHTAHEAAKLARNPFSRTLRETDYDYDSEAEWEEPEDGEDLDSEGEDDLEEEGDEDMQDFLDDEDDPQLKRRLISGDLEPVSTGLCWEDARGVSRLNDGSGAISTEFREFRMGFLLDPQPRSIDPFSTAYWAPDPKALPITLPLPSSNSAMNPPRVPLTQRAVNGMLNTFNVGGGTSNQVCKAAKPPKRMIPHEHLPDFKAAVQGSDLTKIALVEALKKQFPKFPKDAISNTLSAVAVRVGAKEVEKRWVLLSS